MAKAVDIRESRAANIPGRVCFSDLGDVPFQSFKKKEIYFPILHTDCPACIYCKSHAKERIHITTNC